MPFSIIRDDITRVSADAIVNTANPKPVVGTGVDTAIHRAAGPRLLESRKKIGSISVGEVAVTPAFDLDAKYVIHAVGPNWSSDEQNAPEYLRKCYENSLRKAEELCCNSIAFPLLATGNYKFPKPLALSIATDTISSFLQEHDMQVYLVVFNRDAFALSENLCKSVQAYIDDHYVEQQISKEYDIVDGKAKIGLDRICEHEVPIHGKTALSTDISEIQAVLGKRLTKLEPDFSEELFRRIDKSGKKDSEIYRKANVSKQTFSKIRKNRSYRPSRETALALAIALELSREETQKLIGRAGYTLSDSSVADIIISYCIITGNYDISRINELLFLYDQPLLGASEK